MAVGSLSLWVASPGVLSQPPASLGGCWVAALSRSTIARWQEATDPQSLKGVSGPDTLGCHPTASGLVSRVAVGPQSLWVASLGSESSPSSLARKSLTAWVHLTIGPHGGELFAE